MAVLLWGCGGSTSSDTATTTNILSPAVGNTSSALSSGAAGTDSTSALRSLNTFDKLVIPASAQDIPQDFKAAYDQAKPIVILFYVPGQPDDSRVLTSLQTLRLRSPATPSSSTTTTTPRLTAACLPSVISR